jgi:3-isopropylmalate/(R)-2-methylmalate dehydratase small subunit
MNIGILPVQVSEDFLDRIFKAIETDPQTQLEVDLSKQTITILTTGDSESFDINSYKKHNLMNGFDDIDYLQAMKEEISAFAQNSRY